MRQFRLVCVALVCLIATAWSQNGSPAVYVSGGGSIFKVTSAGVTTTLLTTANAVYEGLVVGPDNVGGDNPAHPFLLYACDPTHNTIIRFDPENAPAQGGSAAETVYNGGALQQPQCGRFTNTGDLIVTSKVAGSGLWKIAGVANIAFRAGGFSAPSQNPPNGAFSVSQVGAGLAQKNTGDLLVVDTVNKEVIRSQYATVPAFSGPPSVFIAPSNLLGSPFGITRQSAGKIFISNQTKRNQIVQFSAQGTGGATCVNTLGNNITPGFMQTSADDTLYIAASASHGAVFAVNSATCTATQIPTGNTLPPLVGIALPPTSVSQTQVISGTATFNFGFTAYQFTSPSCTLTVTATPANLAVINSNIPAPNPLAAPPYFGAVPAVNLGWDGFEFMLNVINQDAGGNFVNCVPQFGTDFATDGTSEQAVGSDLDNLLVFNPRLVRCPNAGDPDAGGPCALDESLGVYPLGGLLPQDLTLTTPGKQCTIFAVNANLSAVQQGVFCGFESPLSDVAPPGISGTFSSGQNVSLKFKLASATGDCQNGPFLSGATALLSVAQLFDAKGKAVFAPVAINSSGSSTPLPPTFKVDTKNQYQFSLSLKGYAKGTYSITVTFLSDETVQQTVLIKVI